MELTSQVRDFLNEQRFAVLATINPDGTPQQTVMWYTVRENLIVMNSTLARVKGKNLQRDPRLSICIEDGYRYVTISGMARLIEDQSEAQADIRALAIRYNGEEVGARQAETEFAREQRVAIYLPIEDIVVSGF